MGRFPISRHPLAYALVMLMAWPWGPLLLAWEASVESSAEQGTFVGGLLGRQLRNTTRLERIGPAALIVLSQGVDEEEGDDDGSGLVESGLSLLGFPPSATAIVFHHAYPPRIDEFPPPVTHLCRLRC
ncbi:hypothetical protein ACYOEI_17130 [Singulisphaera rosea]